VRRDGRVSWAIGPTLPFRSNLTGYQTIKFICDIYEIRRSAAVELTREMVDAPYDLDKPTSRWQVPAVIQLSYTLALLPHFDVYVIDGPIKLGYPVFYERWRAAFEERVRNRPLIVSTAQIALASKVATIGALVENEKLLRVDNVRDHLKPTAAPAPVQAEESEDEETDDDML
jgi:ABC-type polysaccharide/polyol phosphate transport system ATPase subunit